MKPHFEKLHRLFGIALLGTLGAVALADEAKKPAAPKANCEVKLVREASSGGTMTLSFNAPTKEECLKNSEPGVEASYKGRLQPMRAGAGPRE